MDKATQVLEKIALTNPQEDLLLGAGIGGAFTAPYYMKPKRKMVVEANQLKKVRELAGAAKRGKPLNRKEVAFMKGMYKKYTPSEGSLSNWLKISPETKMSGRAAQLNKLLGMQKAPMKAKIFKTLGEAGKAGVLLAGLSALMGKYSSLEMEKQAGPWTNIGAKIIKGIGGYGANIAKDYKTLTKGVGTLDTVRAGKAAKKMSNARKLKMYQLEERANKQIMQGAAGLGKRVGIPGLLAYTSLT